MNNDDNSDAKQKYFRPSNENTFWPQDQWLWKFVNYSSVFTLVAIYYYSYPECILVSPGSVIQIKGCSLVDSSAVHMAPLVAPHLRM